LPSWGTGGGIESYFAALNEALTDLGVRMHKRTLRQGSNVRVSIGSKVRFVLDSARLAHRVRKDSSNMILALHPALWFVGALAQVIGHVPSARCFLFFYGADIDGQGKLGRRFLRRAGWRIVAISSFGAGALVEGGPVTVLSPGIPRGRYERLLSAVDSAPTFDLLTVFRLEDAELKGVYEVFHACDVVRRQGRPLTLVIAGSGRAPVQLLAEVAKRQDWVRLEEELTFEDLATLYSRARVLVLATRSHQSGGKGFRGEGFGIVLAEAQLAGTPVIAPCGGGTSDAFVEDLTGLSPYNESAEALVHSIQRLLSDPELMNAMSNSAAVWSRHRFAPERYRTRVSRALLGQRHP
jgi:glycosyltransferase involved in cell wall biosynthesis